MINLKLSSLFIVVGCVLTSHLTAQSAFPGTPTATVAPSLSFEVGPVVSTETTVMEKLHLELAASATADKGGIAIIKSVPEPSSVLILTCGVAMIATARKFAKKSV